MRRVVVTIHTFECSRFAEILFGLNKHTASIGAEFEL